MRRDSVEEISLKNFVEGAKLRSAVYEDNGLDMFEREVCELMFRRAIFRRHGLLSGENYDMLVKALSHINEKLELDRSQDGQS